MIGKRAGCALGAAAAFLCLRRDEEEFTQFNTEKQYHKQHYTPLTTGVSVFPSRVSHKFPRPLYAYQSSDADCIMSYNRKNGIL
jgi:hypothetical protein